MAVYFVQGKLGSGKTLAAIHRMQEALNQGRKVATNIDLFLEHLVNPWAKETSVLRLPDKPSPDDFDAIPLGYEGDYKSEDENGDMHLDECAIWFNSRNWNDKGRAKIIEWIVHARKRRWNIYFYVQDIDVVDKQARDMFAEHLVTCKRTDRFNIPLIGWILNPLLKTTIGKKLPLPKYHLATVQYGTGQFSPIVDRWWYKGTKLYNAYRTEQQFLPPEHPDALGIHSMLTPWHIYGRHITKKEHIKNEIRNFALKGRHFFLIGAGLAVLGTNAAVTAMPEVPKKGVFGCNDAYKALYGSCDAYPVEGLKDGVPVKANSTKSVNTIKKSSLSDYGLSNLYSTGSVQSGDGVHYFFTSGGRPVDLALSGWQIEPIDWCSAIIQKDDFRTVVYCNPFVDDTPVKQQPQQTSITSPDVVGNAIEPLKELFE